MNLDPKLVGFHFKKYYLNLELESLPFFKKTPNLKPNSSKRKPNDDIFEFPNSICWHEDDDDNGRYAFPNVIWETKYSNLLTATHDDDDHGAYAFGNPIWGTKHFHLLALPS